jgi:hypothetical protein
MAWVAEETFEGLSTGDLNGQGGGSGWSANWSGSANYDVQNTVAYEGSQGVVNASGSNISRTLTTGISGTENIMYIAVRKTSTSAGVNKVRLNTSGGAVLGEVSMNASGNIVARLNGSITVLNGYSADTWYVLRININATAETYKVAYSTDAYGTEGSFSADSSDATFEETGTIGAVQFDADTGNTNYWDYISGTSPFPSASAAKLMLLMGVGT